jgi:DNA repair protein RadA/Sms
MVDTVLYFEGDGYASYRLLRAVKNRFGKSNEIGVFEMEGSGLREVKNPSEYMLSGMPQGEPGSVICATMEGTRTILVEVQALVTQTNMNFARRTANGTDYNRVSLLIAVIEKRLGIKLGFCDAFVNVAGGMKVSEPALDLAVVLAVLSSYYNKPVEKGVICFGEVGLTGEVRAVTMAKERVAEALKLGYTACVMPLADKTSKSMQGFIIEKVKSSRAADSLKKCVQPDINNSGGRMKDKENNDAEMSVQEDRKKGMKLVGISNIRDLSSFFQ